MTTRKDVRETKVSATPKDVEEALGWFRSMFKRMYIPCKVLEVIEQALQEKLERIEQGDMNVGLWRDIETAPKDGTDILVTDKFGEVNQVVWLHCDELWASIGGKGDVWNYLTSEPSHWMPLPQPPKAVSETNVAPKEQMEKSDAGDL